MIVRQIRTPRDAVDTAVEAHIELDNSERSQTARTVTSPKVGSKSWLFSRSRYRRARIYDALAVALLLAVCALLGAAVFFLSTGTAKADSADAVAYAAHYGDAICENLDEFPTPAGVFGTGQAIMQHSGMSAYDAGQAIAFSVYELCPRHWPLILRVAGTGTVAA